MVNKIFLIFISIIFYCCGTYASSIPLDVRLVDSKLSCELADNDMRKLTLWMNSSLKNIAQNTLTISCPSPELEHSMDYLEGITSQKYTCSEEATAFLFALYALFESHSVYAECGFSQRLLSFSAKIIPDGKACQGVDNVNECFSNLTVIISKLKIQHKLNEAFSLAKKIADSGDTTGISQLFLGFFYEYGEGTTQNIPLAIYWFQQSLKKLHDPTLRQAAITGLNAAHN